MKFRNSAVALVLIIVGVRVKARGFYINICIYFSMGTYVVIYVIYWGLLLGR